MATKVYQLYDPATNLYATVYPKWTKNGKVWNSEAAFKLGLSNWLVEMTVRTPGPFSVTTGFKDFLVIETDLSTVTQAKIPLLLFAKTEIDKKTKEVLGYSQLNKANCNHLRALCGLPLFP